MRMFSAVLAFTMTLAIAGAATAATPEQVGTYAGSIAIKRYSASGVTANKASFEVSIAADDSTTVTINGTPTVSESAFAPTYGLLAFYADPGLATPTYCAVQFKKTKIKGTGVGYVESAPPISAILEAKLSLKKTAP